LTHYDRVPGGLREPRRLPIPACPSELLRPARGAKDCVKQPASMRRPVAVANAPNSARVTGKRPIANGRAIVMAVTG
jgi:hypothetical protein